MRSIPQIHGNSTSYYSGYNWPTGASPISRSKQKTLRKLEQDKKRNHTQTITNIPETERLYREIQDLLQECSEPDWNGYDAKPLSKTSTEYVQVFINYLPNDISFPELCALPTGDMSMIWDKNGYYITVGIDDDSNLYWGGTTPSGTMYGACTFEHDIPKEILSVLKLIEPNQ